MAEPVAVPNRVSRRGDDVFADPPQAGGVASKDTLPPHGVGLAQLINVQLRAVSDAYGDLYVHQAAVGVVIAVRRGTPRLPLAAWKWGMPAGPPGQNGPAGKS